MPGQPTCPVICDACQAQCDNRKSTVPLTTQLGHMISRLHGQGCCANTFFNTSADTYNFSTQLQAGGPVVLWGWPNVGFSNNFCISTHALLFTCFRAHSHLPDVSKVRPATTYPIELLHIATSASQSNNMPCVEHMENTALLKRLQEFPVTALSSWQRMQW